MLDLIFNFLNRFRWPAIRRSYIVAAAIAAATGAWILSGQIDGLAKNPDPNADLTAGTRVEKIAVRARINVAENRRSEIILSGRTQAVRKVQLRSEIDSRVVALPREKGEIVATGDVICRLDMQDRKERKLEAQAVLRQRELEYKAAKALSSKGYFAETQLAAARSRLDGARAAVARITVEIGHTEIRAPFDGVIEERPAEIGYYLQKGHICATVIDQDPFLVVGQVSEREVGLLKIGAIGKILLVTGETYDGTIRFVSNSAQETTRTFRLELEIPNPDRRLRDGVTAEIRVPAEQVKAHRIPSSLLTLDDAGVMGVRIVEGQDTVRFVPVEFLGDGPDGIWVTGLPETVTLITVGHEFVKDGQKVIVTLEEKRAGT